MGIGITTLALSRERRDFTRGSATNDARRSSVCSGVILIEASS